MWGLSLYDKFKSLDVYRKLPSDFVQPTYSGALRNKLDLTRSFYCQQCGYGSSFPQRIPFLYRNQDTLRDVHRCQQRRKQGKQFNIINLQLNINVDIDLVHLPCSILSLDVQDIMGSHSVNIQGNLMKYRLDKDGKTIAEEKYQNGENQMPDYEMVKNEIVAKEGCRIKGYFIVNKVNLKLFSIRFLETSIFLHMPLDQLYKD